MAAVDRAIQLQANGTFNRVGAAGTLEVGLSIDAVAVGPLNIGAANANAINIVTSSATIAKFDGSGVLSLLETAAPAATANFGKLYVKSTDSNLYFKDDGGTEYQLTPPSSPTLYYQTVQDEGVALTQRSVLNVVGDALTASDVGGKTQLSANAFSSTTSGIVGASGGGTSNFLRADGTWTAPPGSITTAYQTIQEDGVSLTQRSTLNFVGDTFTASDFGGVTQVAANAFSATTAGVVGASGGGTSNFLRADGTWTAPAGTFTGSLAATQVAYGSGANAITGSASFVYDGTNLTVQNYYASSGGIDRSAAGALAIGATNATSQTFGVGGVTLMTLGSTASDRITVAGGTIATTKYALVVTATLPNPGATTEVGNVFSVTSAGASNSRQYGMQAGLNAGYTGSGGTLAVNVYNYAAGTGTTPIGGTTLPVANVGVVGVITNGGTAGHGVGLYGFAQRSTARNYGVIGVANNQDVGSPAQVGVYGTASSSAGTPLANIGVAGTLYGNTDTIGTLTSAAGYFDNAATTSPILLGRDNGSTVFQVADGGGVYVQNALYSYDTSVNGGFQFDMATNSGPTIFVAIRPVNYSGNRFLSIGTAGNEFFGVYQGSNDRTVITVGAIASGKSALLITATQSATAAAQTGISTTITGAGSDANAHYAESITYSAGFTGSGASRALTASNANAGTGTAAIASAGGNGGVFGAATATTTGTNYGTLGSAQGGNTNYGAVGVAVTLKNSATNIGVAGYGLNAGTSPIQIGGYFALRSSDATYTGLSAALVADNGTQTSPTLLGLDNGTNVFQVADGGILTSSPGGTTVLTVDATSADRVTITGATQTASKRTLSITGTLANPGGSDEYGQYSSWTTNGVGGSRQVGIFNTIGGTNSGTGRIAGMISTAEAPTTTSTLISYPFPGGGAYGVLGYSYKATAGAGVYGYTYNAGLDADGTSSTRGIGVLGVAEQNTTGASASTIGVYGTVRLDAGAGAIIGGMFTLYGTTDSIGTLATTALLADNASSANPIFLGRDSGTTVFTIADGGDVTIAPVSGHAGSALTVTGGTLATTKQAISVTGTLPTTNASQNGMTLDITTTAGSSGQRTGLNAALLAGATNNSVMATGIFSNAVLGAGTTPLGSSIGPANYGVAGSSSGSGGTGTNVGGKFYASTSTVRSYGVQGQAYSTAGSPANLGVYGTASSGGGTPVIIGVAGTLYGNTDSIGTLTSAAGYFDNAAATDPILLGRDNGTTVFQLIDGGLLGVGSSFTPTYTIHAKTGSTTSVGAESTNTGVLSYFEAKNSGGKVTSFGIAGSTLAGNVFGIAQANSAQLLTSSTPSSFLIGNLNDVPMYFGINNTEVVRVGATTDSRVFITGGTIATAKYALAVTSTLANPGATSEVGNIFSTTSAGAGNSKQYSAQIGLNAGYTGSGSTAALYTYNYAAGTGTTVMGGSAVPVANVGVAGTISNAGVAGHGVGIYGFAQRSTARNYGVVGVANNQDVGSPAQIGVYGTGSSSAGTPLANIGGMFTLYGNTDTIGTLTSAALYADNATTADPILLGRDNGTTVFSIADGGTVTFAPGGSTVATLDSSGFGIGTTATTTIPFAILRTQNNYSGMGIQNASTGTAGRTNLYTSNSTHSINQGILSTGYSGTLAGTTIAADESYIYTDAAALVVENSTSTGSIRFGLNATTLMTLGSATNHRALIAGGTLASTKNALRVTATLPNTAASQYASEIVVTGSTATALFNKALGITLTGTAVNSTGIDMTVSTSTAQANGIAVLVDTSGTGHPYGGIFEVNPSATSTEGYGIYAGASYGTAARQIGVFAYAVVDTSVANVAVQGFALSTTGKQVGGHFGLYSDTPATPSFSGALIADNGATTDDIIAGLDNNSRVFRVLDGGDMAIGTTPASAGKIRIPNNTNLASRNAGNSADVNLIGLNASNQPVSDGERVEVGQWVWKTADETVTGSSTLQADNELLVTVAAGDHYEMEIYGFADLGASSGLSIALNGTATLTDMKVNMEVFSSSGASVAFGRVTALNTPVDHTGAGSGNHYFTIKGSFTVNAGGTIGLYWAQYTTTNSATVQKNSFIKVTRLKA